MATYAIGDLQGCYRELCSLLELISFNEQRDTLWFTGDLVNRGNDSLSCLRLVKSLGDSAHTVLGNHDLHLLALAAGQTSAGKKDTLDEILAARDRDQLLEWLRYQPLLVRDDVLGYTMVHAGIPPQWTIQDATAYAHELETVLRSESIDTFFRNMYGDTPSLWNDSLQGWDRLRFITNCFTRMRYCTPEGEINLKEKGPPGSQENTLLPWYMVPARKSLGNKIIFGHWSTIRLGEQQDFYSANVFPLDTGCIWGGELTAMRLDDQEMFSVASENT